MSHHSFSSKAIKIFKKSIDKYHLIDKVDQSFENPFQSNSIDHLLYRKNWIDTVQWHLEDLVRKPNLNPKVGLFIK